jgi:FlaA1/EpsC-like NDP-sugar epimerase
VSAPAARLETFDLDSFIARRITGRSTSLFADDLAANGAELRARIEGRSALVIGGAGSIGSSFIHALLRYRPRSLVVVDSSENGLTELTRDLRSIHGQYVPEDYRTYPIALGTPVFERLLAAEGPFDIVADFAAHKHVRSEKDRYSIEAMLHTNVIDTVGLLDALLATPPERFFCVSTDKAANPANVMGASKKLMEQAVLAYATDLPATTARFANVAFSNGSLPDGFLRRLAKGQPLSAPSDVRRYFVSPIESGELCLLACVLGEPGDILFPKLDAPTTLTFSSIADALLEELGYTPVRCATEDEARAFLGSLGPGGDEPSAAGGSREWPVYYFESDTSGEKPVEEFFTADEHVDLERFSALGVVRAASTDRIEDVRATRDDLVTLFERAELPKAAIVDTLRTLVPTFEHVETGRGLDSKM